MSGVAKVLVGGTVVLITGGAVVLAAPILLPGTALAAAVTSAMTGVSTLVGTSVATVSAAAKVGAVALVSKMGDAVDSVKNGVNNFSKLSVVGKIQVTGEVLQKLGINPLISGSIPTNRIYHDKCSADLENDAAEAELYELEMRKKRKKSLKEFIREVHFSQ